jgi:hypothetical protein
MTSQTPQTNLNNYKGKKKKNLSWLTYLLLLPLDFSAAATTTTT